MIISKNVNNKKCAPKLVFFNEKDFEKKIWPLQRGQKKSIMIENIWVYLIL
jgi:hypothetical protein